MNDPRLVAYILKDMRDPYLVLSLIFCISFLVGNGIAIAISTFSGRTCTIGQRILLLLYGVAQCLFSCLFHIAHITHTTIRDTTICILLHIYVSQIQRSRTLRCHIFFTFSVVWIFSFSVAHHDLTDSADKWFDAYSTCPTGSRIS